MRDLKKNPRNVLQENQNGGFRNMGTKISIKLK